MSDCSNGSLKILYNDNDKIKDEKPKSGVGHCDIVDAGILNTSDFYLNTDTSIGFVPPNLVLNGSYTPVGSCTGRVKDIKIGSNIDNFSISDEELKVIADINELEDLALPLDKIQQMAKELLKLRSLWYRQ